MYSDNKPLKLFADPLTHNLHQMNSIYEEIEYLFVHAGVKNFEKYQNWKQKGNVS